MKDQLVMGMEEGLRGEEVELDPSPLQKKISQMVLAGSSNPARVSLALRLKIDEATPIALRMVSDARFPEPERKMLAGALADLRIDAAVPVFLELLQREPSDVLKAELLGSLQRFSNPEIAAKLIEGYGNLPRHLQITTQGILASRKDWSDAVLAAVESGKIRTADITEATLSAIRKHHDPKQEQFIAKRWQSSDENKKTAAAGLQPALQLGEQNYRSRCSYCHLATGQGMKRSLVNSRWVQGIDGSLIRILLQGKQGDTDVMPGFGTEMDDAQIASVLTYVRRQWGNEGQRIEPSTVGEVRSATTDRKKPWTEEELLNFLK